MKLANKGFNVIAIPALRSMGDSGFIPRNVHLDNYVQTFYVAKDNDLKGVIITSWAVRRSSLQLTNNVLNVVSDLFENENITYKEEMENYVEKTNGVRDVDLARLSFIFAEAVNKVIEQPDFLTSGHDFMDHQTEMLLLDSVEKRLGDVDVRNNFKVKEDYLNLLNTATECKIKMAFKSTW